MAFVRVRAFFDLEGGRDMVTQSKTENTVAAEGWVGIDDRQFQAQRSGGGFLTLLMFPLIAIAALAYAAAELAK